MRYGRKYFVVYCRPRIFENLAKSPYRARQLRPIWGPRIILDRILIGEVVCTRPSQGIIKLGKERLWQRIIRVFSVDKVESIRSYWPVIVVMILEESQKY